MSKYIIFLLIAVDVMASVASLLLFNVYLIILSVSASLLLFFLYKLWDVFESLVIKRTGIIQLVDDYELEGDRISAVRKKGEIYSAVSAAVLRDMPSKELDREGIERIIASSNAPFRFVLQVAKLNTGKIFDDLKTRRRMKEIELSRAGARKGDDPTKVVERELELIEGEIRAINMGAVPLKTSIYLMSFAESESKFASEERALSQVKALAGEFSAVLGAGFEVLNGAELISVMRSDILGEVESHEI
jgi:hypothetical protein